MLALEEEDAAFLKNFLMKSGSLKDIAKLYGVSYPTVRLRLDKLIQKVSLSEQKEEEPFLAFIDVYKRQGWCCSGCRRCHGYAAESGSAEHP